MIIQTIEKGTFEYSCVERYLRKNYPCKNDELLVMNFEMWSENEFGYSVIYKNLPLSISVYEKSILELVRKKKLLKIKEIYEN